jgi:predicted permease
MGLDLRMAFRQLRRAPGTAAAAVVTLAVGIGATTAIVSFVTAVMSAASPAPDMERLVGLWSHNRGESETKGLVSPGDFVEWRRRARSFSAVAAWRGQAVNVSGAGSPIRVPAQLVTSHYFAIFGWQPILGRDFITADAQPGAPRTAIVSNVFWERVLAGQPDVVGSALRIDGVPTLVVGVLPKMPGVNGLFLPLVDPDPQDRSSRTLFVQARLASGVTIEQARVEMEAIGEALEREFPATNRGWAINTRPLQEEFVGPQARVVFALLIAIVVSVLLIGCVNIANLLLARGLARRGELAVRLALGAGRWRLIRQLIIESGVLAGLGGLLSIVVSRWTLAILASLGEVDSPWIENGGLNVRALLVAAAASLVAAVAAGLAPAVQFGGRATSTELRASGRSTIGMPRRLTRALLAAQVALAVTLLVVAGLATRTLIAVQRLDPGFDLSNLLTATVSHPDSLSPQAAAQWVDEALARLRSLPGVVGAGATSRLPFAGSRWNPNRGLEIEGRPSLDAAGHWAVDYVVTAGLTETLRVPLLEGRTFSDGDGADAPPVVLVNAAMVRRYWPDRSPLGARLRQGDDPPGTWRTVIGVVGDIRNDDADQPPLPYVYVPLPQRPHRTMTLTVRTAGDPAALAEPLRRAVASFDPDQALYDVRTMQEVWEADLRQTALIVDVMGALALVALGLAGLGLWGVAAHSVGQRTREIGMRVALGARPADIGRLIAVQGLIPVAAGLAVGLAIGLGAAHLMRSILFQVAPTDPVTVSVTVAALGLVGVAATVGPAMRASRLDPIAALRQD